MVISLPHKHHHGTSAELAAVTQSLPSCSAICSRRRSTSGSGSLKAVGHDGRGPATWIYANEPARIVEGFAQLLGGDEFVLTNLSSPAATRARVAAAADDDVAHESTRLPSDRTALDTSVRQGVDQGIRVRGREGLGKEGLRRVGSGKQLWIPLGLILGAESMSPFGTRFAGFCPGFGPSV
jgi:hypothetical protein